MKDGKMNEAEMDFEYWSLFGKVATFNIDDIPPEIYSQEQNSGILYGQIMTDMEKERIHSFLVQDKVDAMQKDFDKSKEKMKDKKYLTTVDLRKICNNVRKECWEKAKNVADKCKNFFAKHLEKNELDFGFYVQKSPNGKDYELFFDFGFRFSPLTRAKLKGDWLSILNGDLNPYSKSKKEKNVKSGEKNDNSKEEEQDIDVNVGSIGSNSGSSDGGSSDGGSSDGGSIDKKRKEQKKKEANALEAKQLKRLKCELDINLKEDCQAFEEIYRDCTMEMFDYINKIDTIVMKTNVKKLIHNLREALDEFKKKLNQYKRKKSNGKKKSTREKEKERERKDDKQNKGVKLVCEKIDKIGKVIKNLVDYRKKVEIGDKNDSKWTKLQSDVRKVLKFCQLLDRYTFKPKKSNKKKCGSRKSLLFDPNYDYQIGDGCVNRILTKNGNFERAFASEKVYYLWAQRRGEYASINHGIRYGKYGKLKIISSKNANIMKNLANIMGHAGHYLKSGKCDRDVGELLFVNGYTGHSAVAQHVDPMEEFPSDIELLHYGSEKGFGLDAMNERQVQRRCRFKVFCPKGCFATMKRFTPCGDAYSHFFNRGDSVSPTTFTGMVRNVSDATLFKSKLIRDTCVFALQLSENEKKNINDNGNNNNKRKNRKNRKNRKKNGKNTIVVQKMVTH